MIDFTHVHCVGIGGIGLSAVAKFLKLHSIPVSGSEDHVFEVVEDVKNLKIPVTIGFSPANIPHETDLVVYSDAFRDNNVEVNAAHARGIKTISYAEMLGVATSGTKLFAVTGTNGKSTTTAMLGKVLEAAGVDPTVLVGTKVSGFPYGNLRAGDPDIWVVEADDYREHFLALSPSHAIINNVELDHLDYFKDYESVERAFSRFVEKLKPDGTLILNADNPGSLALKKQYPTAKTFGLNHLADADFRAVDIHVGEESGTPRMVFTVKEGESVRGEIKLRVPGEMNVANALGVVAMTREQGIDFSIIKNALESFTGVWRRFELIGVDPVVITDYAHHPTAIKPTITAAREFYPGKPLITVFQPHQEDRLRALFKEFVESFDEADTVILAPIFKATGREGGEPMSSETLAEALRVHDAMRGIQREVVAFETEEMTMEYVESIATKESVILSMSAGERYGVVRELHKTLHQKFSDYA